MNGTEVAMLCGAGFGLGAWLIVRSFLRTDPHLGSALRQLQPTSRPRPEPDAADLTVRVGRWAQPLLAGTHVRGARDRDLDLLGIDPARHVGEKLVGGVFGLLAPATITALFALVGVDLPAWIPALAGLAFGVGLFLAPDISATRRAREYRVDFARALAAYMDLVALERTAAAGVTEAMESAASISQAPAFLRLRECLANARFSGQAPWEGLAELGDQVGVPELVDVANIMRLAGEQSSASAATLKARSAAIRNTLAEEAHAQANSAGEQMIVPLSLLAFVYLSILAAPGLLRVMASL